MSTVGPSSAVGFFGVLGEDVRIGDALTLRESDGRIYRRADGEPHVATAWADFKAGAMIRLPDSARRFLVDPRITTPTPRQSNPDPRRTHGG